MLSLVSLCSLFKVFHLRPSAPSKLMLVLCLFLVGSPALALEHPEQDLDKAAITTKLGAQVNLDNSFIDESGKSVRLRDVAKDGRPFIVIPAYYHCPRLCGLVLKAVHDLIPQLGLKLDEDFRIITVSFDISDTPALASERAAEFHAGLGAAETSARGWRFLTGSEDNVKSLMQQIGFHYLRDDGEFAHSAAIMILTPEGQISQYFTGISFTPRDAKLALVEAGRGSIGSAIDHFLLFCFRFDQTKGRYTWAAFNVMRAGGALTLVLLAGLVIFLRRKERAASPNH